MDIYNQTIEVNEEVPAQTSTPLCTFCFEHCMMNTESVALICFRCADDLLRHHIPDSKSFVTEKGGPSRCFRNFAEATKSMASNRDRRMQRWTEWDNGVNKHMRQHVSAETLARLSAEFAGGEDWVSMVGNGRVSILYSCPACLCAPLRMNGWVRGRKSTRNDLFCPKC
eukprot:1932356-Amphidinium_carterae.1